MGAIGEAFAAYAQPLLDQTDGSEEQLNKAFMVSQLCYNLALMPTESQETAIAEMRPSLNMNDEEFDDFRNSIVVPMLQRHQEMFPQMHGRDLGTLLRGGTTVPERSRKVSSADAFPGTNRYAPCPCNSGRKYKFCCGKTRR